MTRERTLYRGRSLQLDAEAEAFARYCHVPPP